MKSAWRLALHLFSHLLLAPYNASPLHAVRCFHTMFIWLYSPCLEKLRFHKYKLVPFLKHISILRQSQNSKSGLKTQIWETLACFQKEQPHLPHTINNFECIHTHTQHIGCM